MIYEVNTAIWLAEKSRAAGQRVTLADVPASAWDDVTPAGVDAVWLMGVWERSPVGLKSDSSRAAEYDRRSSCRAGPPSHRTPAWPAGTGGC